MEERKEEGRQVEMRRTRAVRERTSRNDRQRQLEEDK